MSGVSTSAKQYVTSETTFPISSGYWTQTDKTDTGRKSRTSDSCVSSIGKN